MLVVREASVILREAVSVDLFWVRSSSTGMWQVNERRGNKWWTEQIKTCNACKHKDNGAHCLKGYSQYNCIFQNDKKSAWMLELEQLSCTRSSCSVLHECNTLHEHTLWYFCAIALLMPHCLLLSMCVVVQSCWVFISGNWTLKERN